MKFNLKQFYAFCAQLKIETKEQGLRKMDTLLGTQTYVMDEIAKGLDEDIHMFIIFWAERGRLSLSQKKTEKGEAKSRP